MKLRILGCGTSSGVPRIGNDWGDCDPAEPRNRRSRASILVSSDTTNLLIDTTPDMRQQLLAADIIDIDAILWTHDHADHCHGIDDCRQIFHARRAPVPGYGFAETMAQLEQRFAYVFHGRDGYPPTVARYELAPDIIIGDIRVRTVAQPHGSIYSAGFRFEHDGKSIGYSTDFHEFTDDMCQLFEAVDIWVVDALRERPHPTHAHLGLTLDAIARCGPGRAILTHMDQSMDYASLSAVLPAGIEPGYDGQDIRL
ncbi:MBL fold metallo-hydrolase [Rhizorhabdus dicambivorans]|uniref:MBL fold metallo-hydrolase n=1 Tax=Rhizorhabdus dicambivorans TaxID=1850238 RepID=A0A2A4FXJ6_9SPHN|nr:MBL fold metallo-hydrolase [Rhizorhabdus dicambivorans]ATE65266.1 MBL fold metallo-hydrolase [Rhizorhabdus dicambivorans]PCE42409.1 MBL fold metallo-hydrolase [Rhizorhabdus dicambivorans]